MKLRTSLAFTLIELLLVLSIIALLVSILLPTAGRVRDAANLARCQTKLGGLANAYMAYTMSFREGRPPPIWSIGEYAGDGKWAGWYYPQNSYQIVINKTFRGGFGPLVWHSLVRDSDTFVCPVIADSHFPWWHDRPLPSDPDNYWSGLFSNPDPIKVWEQYNLYHRVLFDYTRSSYNIRPYMYPYSTGKLAADGVKAIMADTLSVPMCVLERHVDGVNVAYMNGSVRYVTARLLWDNEMSWNYVPHEQTMIDIWKLLDEPE